MILHFGYGGRLGNQLFVLAYIERVRRRSEWVVCTRLGFALKSVARMPRYLDFSGRLAIFLAKKILRPLVENWLVPSKVLSFQIETQNGEVACGRGMLPITYLKGNYQFGSLATNPPPFKLRGSYMEHARQILNEAGGRVPLFVHVRRGDYLGYKVRGWLDPSLPLEYYRSAMNLLLADVRDPFVFFLGDEPEWLSPTFGFLPHARIARRDAPLDLAIMSLCWGGVISNSTFAWWGAFLCRRRKPVISPLFWLGWRSREWYPTAIQTEQFHSIDVASLEAADARI